MEEDNQLLDKMFQVADNLLKTSPIVRDMVDKCPTQESKNLMLALCTIREMTKDVLINKESEQ